jgi:hypothetical protein
VYIGSKKNTEGSSEENIIDTNYAAFPSVFHQAVSTASVEIIYRNLKLYYVDCRTIFQGPSKNQVGKIEGKVTILFNDTFASCSLVLVIYFMGRV